MLCVFLYADQKCVHVFVALCDNDNQGIVPVPEKIGNGNDAANNLYWGALYGTKAFFKRSKSWKLLKTYKNPTNSILERCVFKNRNKNVYLIADAYKGIEIKKAIVDFFNAAAGKQKDTISILSAKSKISIPISGQADLIVYVGHDGLMDFNLEKYPAGKKSSGKEAIVLACMSKSFFSEGIKASGAKGILLTTGLMAPEAYTLHAALNSWVLGKDVSTIKLMAANAYHKYQKCGIKAAKNLFTSID